jgi:hypothetical protein
LADLEAVQAMLDLGREMGASICLAGCTTPEGGRSIQDDPAALLVVASKTADIGPGAE